MAVLELVTKSYKPLKLELGMYFQNVGDILKVWKLENLPENEEEFLSVNGYPVEFNLLDNEGKVVLEHWGIGWWEDYESDVLRLISLEEINNIFEYYDGLVYVEDAGGNLMKLFKGKAIMSYLEEFND